MRVRHILLALAVLVAGMVVTGTAAAAPTGPPVVGTLRDFPTSGTADAAPWYRTSGPCPVGTMSSDIVIDGHGLTSAVAKPLNDVEVSTSAPFFIAQNDTFRYIATAHGTTLQGKYTVSARCVDPFSGEVLGVFRVDIVFLNPNSWVRSPTAPTIAMAIAPGDVVAEGSPVTLSAQVGPADISGTVQFFDGATPISSQMPYPGGPYAVTTSALIPGVHTLTTRFAPYDLIDGPSASTSLVLQVTSGAVATARQNISTEVLAGELLVSVPNQGVVLPAPVMLPDGSMLTTSGQLNPITVIDTRAGNPGWTLSGQVGDFTAGPNRINGANLGWVPGLVSSAAAQSVRVGNAVPPAEAIEPGAVPPADRGLAAARTLADASAAHGNGTATMTALLALKVPTSTVAGTYTAILTLTAI
ncbi:Ig-like domain-containing protein [Actinokineospora terrae]|uniref:Ig-like domain (Group 3) n=1 Tax=Actinokineospora terrae TaxID=155974 RepID=A0A1H9QUV6_9PSEU|nr:Ig-like domain-containing protein [Actinokineospora terrae]SER64228.1 Ig-like domain (group 3) [Actinokineospora terrae]